MQSTPTGARGGWDTKYKIYFREILDSITLNKFKTQLLPQKISVCATELNKEYYTIEP